MIRWLSRLLLPVFLLTAAGPGAAQQSLRPAAVVNDEVISVLDLQMRVRLVMLSSGMQPSREQVQAIAEQVLRTLIDERLQMQEAERVGVGVGRSEVEAAAAEVAERNNMSRERFVRALEQNGVMPETFFDQVRANLAWQRVIRQEIRPQVQIGDEDIEDAVEQLKAQSGKQQMRVREIFLALDEEQQSQQVRRTARRLIEQLRNGADFAALARQFSQSATAATGGDMGWVTPASLPAEIVERLNNMSSGEIAGPISTYDGIHIVHLSDTRRLSIGDEQVRLKQLFLPLRNGANDSAMAQLRAQARDVVDGVQGCDAMSEVSAEAGSAASGDLGTIKLSDLPDNVRDAVAGLDIGKPSEPVQVNQGIAVLMVCDRQRSGIDRERIRQNLVRDRAMMMAQRYLRDLRRSAHIDIRVQ